MATTDVQALGEGNVSNGVLVVHCSGGDELYEITKVPAETAFLVQDAKKKILMNLKLDRVLQNLYRSSDLLYLAYMSVIGTGELQGRISSRQKDLSDLCAECVNTMDDLQQDCHTVLGRLTEAYSYLLEAKEERALRIFSRCSKNSTTMSTKCEKLANGFKILKDDTKQDAVLTSVAWGHQVEKIEALQKLRAEMEETKKKQEALRDDLDKSLAELKVEISKEEARRDSADTHSFVIGIVGAIAGAIGGLAGLSPVGALLGLANTMARSHFNGQLPGEKKGSGNAQQPTPVSKLKEDETSAQKALEDAEKAVAEAREKKETVDRKVFDLKSDNKAKQNLLDAAMKANPSEAGHEEKVREAQAALDASSASLKQVLDDQQKAQEDLDKAKEIASGAQEAAKTATAALKLAEAANQLSKEKADQSKELTNGILSMLKKKSEEQSLRRDAVVQLAALTSRLQSNDQFTTVEHSAQTALEIATWALDNIYASLSEAKKFWDNMQRFCATLADPRMKEKILDEMDAGDTPENRIQFYKSDRFAPFAIRYLCEWTALVNVCGEYVVGSERARFSVLEHIKASPNMEEARKLIEPLKKKLQDELAADAAQFDLNINAFNVGAKEVEALAKLYK